MSAKRGDVSAEATAESLTAWFAHRFEQLELLGNDLVSALTIDSRGILELPPGSRKGMKTAASRFLQKHPVVDGCGLVFAHSALGTEAGKLEWWVREDESRFARYSFGIVPGADRYYDYEQHEWFIRAFREGQSAAVGPYIDYLGVEMYIITLTMPAVVDGVRVGSVGTDIQLEDLERALLPTLLSCASDFVLISGQGSVLLSNTSRYLPGEALTEPVEGFEFRSLFGTSDGMRVLVPSTTSS